MKSLIGSFIGLVLSISVGAEPLLEGRVSLSSGQPAAGVQVRLFDWTDLRRFVSTTTDETGHFALPLRAFSTARSTALPTDFALGQNYPNPFNPSTIIPYQLPTSAHVRLDVFNLLGQRLATLVDAEQSAGIHTAQWDATDAAGRAVGAGVYIYRLSSGEMTESRRMVLVDGQAGIPAVGAAPRSVRSAVEGAVEADGSVYGLTVSGAGLIPYVNPTFRVGVDEVDIVVEEYSSARMKLAADGVLGDVDGNGQVDVFDVLFVLLYSVDSSIVLPNNGDISRGDVNGDGLVDVADAVLLLRYLSNPSDPALPPGIGQDPDDTPEGATPVDLGSSTDGSLSERDEDYFVVEMSSAGTLTAYTTGDTDTEGYILDSSGNVLDRNDDGGEGWNFWVSAPVSAGTYYIRVEGSYSSATGDYTLHVVGPLDLVVAASVSDSTLAFEQPFTLRATVRNQGGGEPEPTVLFYYSSTDATITSDDTQISADVVNLETSYLVTKSLSLTAPEEAGTYYYGACVQSVSGEHNTDNNCSDAVRVTVSSDFVYTPPTTTSAIVAYSTLVSTFTNIFFAALVPGTTSVPGEGGGTVEIAGNDWTLQDYSPDGALIINGALNINLTQDPIPMSGEVTLSGSHEAELILDMQLSVGADGLSATGTITINGAEFDVAELSAAAAAADGTCTIDSELVGTWTVENADASGMRDAFVDYFISIGLSQTTAEEQVEELFPEEEFREGLGDEIRFNADGSVFGEEDAPTSWCIEDDILFLIADGDLIPYKYFLDGDELHLTSTKAILLSILLEAEAEDFDAAEREIMESIFEPLDEDYVLVRIVLKRKS